MLIANELTRVLLSEKWRFADSAERVWQRLLAPLLQGLAVRPNVDQQVQIMQRTLLSRPNLEQVMRMSDLPEQMNVQFVDVDTRPTGLGEIGNPFIAGAISNAVSYASPNAKALEFVDEDLKTDTSVYPSATVKQRLFADKTLSPECFIFETFQPNCQAL